MGFWSFIRRKVHETSSERPQDVLRDTIASIRERLDVLESEHRKDRLEVLDMHERVKTSLAKMARRARDADPVEAAEPDPLPATASPPRVSLLSRRGRT